jgi:hypothetical protein
MEQSKVAIPLILNSAKKEQPDFFYQKNLYSANFKIVAAQTVALTNKTKLLSKPYK